MHPILTPTLLSKVASQPKSLLIYPLDDLAVFEVTGGDALSFLQGQITNDILNAGPQHAKLAGYCTAQGRLLASMVVANLPEALGQGLIGLMRQDIVAPVLKRLSMFVLRAKVKLSISTYSVVGVSVARTEVAALSQVLGHELPQAAWQMTTATTGLWIGAPTATPQTGIETCRWWWIAGDAQLDVCQGLNVLTALGSLGRWQCEDISAGLPWIQAATQDLLIPQTLNLDLIEGVSFTKGCYPGQEIVARSHYRGTVKRRMHFGVIEQRSNLDISMMAGADIFDAHGSKQACGRVINIASPVHQQPDGTHSLNEGSDGRSTATAYLLFETTFEALEHNALHIGACDGVPVKLVNLPYSTKPA